MDYASAEAEYIGEFAVEEEIVSDDVDLLITEVDLELGEEEPETADDAYVEEYSFEEEQSSFVEGLLDRITEFEDEVILAQKAIHWDNKYYLL